jgi:hypothetical protein
VGDIEELRAELDALLDEKQVVEVTVRYGNAIDAHDWDRLRSCFTPDATANYHVPGGEALRGAEQIADFVRAGDEPLTATQHYITNHAVSVNGNRATATSYVLSQHFRRGAPGGSKFIVGGIYHDTLVRVDGAWQIAERDVQGVWTQGNRAVSFPDA